MRHSLRSKLKHRHLLKKVHAKRHHKHIRKVKEAHKEAHSGYKKDRTEPTFIEHEDIFIAKGIQDLKAYPGKVKAWYAEKRDKNIKKAEAETKALEESAYMEG